MAQASRQAGKKAAFQLPAAAACTAPQAPPLSPPPPALALGSMFS